MEDIIAELRKNPTNLELEIRFAVSYDSYSQILSKMNTDFVELKTLNIITNNTTKNLSIIREFKFENNAKTETFTSKKRLYKTPEINIPNNLSYFVALSRETPCNEALTNNALYRLKNRRRYFVIIDDIKWAIDFTTTRKYSTFELDKLKTERAEFHSKSITELSGTNNSYELEAELIDISKKIEVSHIQKCIDYILTLNNDRYVRDVAINSELVKVAKYFGDKRNATSLKALLPQAKALTAAIYRDLGKDLYLTEKTDGIRTLAIIREKKLIIINDLSCEKTNIVRESSIINDTIVECELLDNVLYAYDIIALDGEDLTQKIFSERMNYIPQACQLIGEFTKIVPKVYYNGDIKTAVEEIMKTNNKTDGIILLKGKDNYKNTINYKWKPIDQNSIDFLAKRVSAGVYYLFVGIRRDLFNSMKLTHVPEYSSIFDERVITADYFPTHFIAPNAFNAHIFKCDTDIDGKIVELRCKSGCGDSCGDVQWELMRIRDDRMPGYCGNDFKVAREIWFNYIDPFPLERLWKAPSVYFQTVKSDMYKAEVTAISIAKSNALEHLNGVVLDLAAGKGQDIYRYKNAQTLICVDTDRSALVELITRNDNKSTGLNIHTLLANLNDPYKTNVEKINKLGYNEVDHVVCNLAIHYFLESAATAQNFVNLCRHFNPKSYTFTFMNGEEIHNTFIQKNIKFGQSIDEFENGVLKHSIKRLYESDDFACYGQKIGIILPFSNGEYYEEYLVNIKYLEELFERKFSYTKIIGYYWVLI